MTIQAEPIRGKVAKVLNARDVALNIGASHGVASGMEFDILSDVQMIIDPDTEELLGEFHEAKVRVRVREVHEKMSIAETFKTRRVNVGGNGIGWGMFTPPRWVRRHETLKRKDAPREELSEIDSYVETGDPVIQVIEVIPETDQGESRKAVQPTP